MALLKIGILNKTVTIPTTASSAGIYFVNTGTIVGIYIVSSFSGSTVVTKIFNSGDWYGPANFQAGNQYLSPTGSAANLTNLPTLNSLGGAAQADLLSEVTNRTNGEINLQNQVSGLAGGSYGTLLYNAAAPTPTNAIGTAVLYTFSSTGTTGSWLGSIAVNSGDGVSVLRTGASTYTYTYVPEGSILHYTDQTLTQSQQIQVQTNINVPSNSMLSDLSMSQLSTESGGIDGTTGLNSVSTTRIRSMYLHYDLIKSFSISSSFVFKVLFYDKSKNFISMTNSWVTTYAFAPDQTKFYVRLLIAYSNTTSTFTGSENLDLVVTGLNKYTDTLNLAVSNYALTSGLTRTLPSAYLLGYSLAGATSITNGFSIPIGSTGLNSIFYLNPVQTSFNTTDYVGKIITCVATIVITNYTSINLNVLPSKILLIRMQGNTLITNSVSPDTFSYTDSIVGSTLTRTLNYTRTVTSSDITNSYWYKSFFQWVDSTVVGAIVTVTLTSFSVTQTSNTSFLDDYKSSTTSQINTINTNLATVTTPSILTPTLQIGGYNTGGVFGSATTNRLASSPITFQNITASKTFVIDAGYSAYLWYCPDNTFSSLLPLNTWFTGTLNLICTTPFFIVVIKKGDGTPIMSSSDLTAAAFTYTDLVTTQTKAASEIDLLAINSNLTPKPTNILYNKIIDTTYSDAIGAFSLSSSGMTLASTGLTNLVSINRQYNLNYRTARYEVIFGANSRILFMTTYLANTFGNLCTIMEVDCSTNKLRIYNAATTLTVLPTMISELLIPFTLVSGRKYVVEQTWNNNTNSLNIIDTVTGLSSILSDSTGLSCRQYDFYALCLYSGSSVTISKVTIRAYSAGCKLAIYGDSITDELYLPDYTKGYASLKINAIGGSGCRSGRGGGSITDLMLRIVNELPYILPKYCMVMIGTNGGNTVSNLTLLVNYIKSLGVIPILNNVPSHLLLVGSTWTEVAINENADIATVRTNIGIAGCLMDLATTINNAGLVTDQTLYYNYADNQFIHPTSAGMLAMSLRASIDCPDIFN